MSSVWGPCQNDSKDLGEIKRVVSSLLQILDNLDNDNTFIAATNYIEVLDKAIVRRFNKVIEFKLPTSKEKKAYITKLIEHSGLSIKTTLVDSLSKMVPNKSYAEIRDWIMNKLKRYVLDKAKKGQSLKEVGKDILEA